MVSDHYSHALSSVRNLLLTAIEPIEKLATLPITAYHFFQQDYETIEDLKQANQRLATENLLLKAEQQQLPQLRLEITRLNQLLNTASQLERSKIQIANISHYNLSPYSQTFMLDKGYLDKVDPNQCVIDSHGLIGLITQVTPTSAKVQLITDADIAIPVRIQRTGQRGIAKGSHFNELSVQFIAKSSSVNIGDLIVTSGLGSVYPKGYPVARVTSVTKPKDQPYLEIKARPVAKIGQADKVLILSNDIKIPSNSLFQGDSKLKLIRNGAGK